MELILPSLEARFGRGHPSVEGLHPVGRLDQDSEGLLLLTNDGAFTHALTHPHHGVTKTYLAEVSGHPTPSTLEKLRTGIEIEGRKTAPAEVLLVTAGGTRERSRVELTLREGRKRQLRKMLSVVGHPIHRLIRTAIGPVSLGQLKPGQFRFLTPGEVRALTLAAAPRNVSDRGEPPGGRQQGEGPPRPGAQSRPESGASSARRPSSGSGERQARSAGGQARAPGRGSQRNNRP
jgi:pseudouridine synthase